MERYKIQKVERIKLGSTVFLTRGEQKLSGVISAMPPVQGLMPWQMLVKIPNTPFIGFGYLTVNINTLEIE